MLPGLGCRRRRSVTDCEVEVSAGDGKSAFDLVSAWEKPCVTLGLRAVVPASFRLCKPAGWSSETSDSPSIFFPHAPSLDLRTYSLSAHTAAAEAASSIHITCRSLVARPLALCQPSARVSSAQARRGSSSSVHPYTGPTLFPDFNRPNLVVHTFSPLLLQPANLPTALSNHSTDLRQQQQPALLPSAAAPRR